MAPALKAALALIVVGLLAAAPASAEPGFEYGEVTRFGGFDSGAYNGGEYKGTPTPGKFLDPTGFAVDPENNTVYVVDRYSKSTHNPTYWRIQQFSPTPTGEEKLTAATMFTLPNVVLPGGSSKASAIEGLAVDHRAGRLYALVVGSTPAARPNPSVPIAQELLAWSIKPHEGGLDAATAAGGGQLPPDPLAGEVPESPGTVGGLVSSETHLFPPGATPLYAPQGIAVDPLEAPGVDNPVAIEASDLAGAGGNPRGDTIVQQVATQPQGATPTGALLSSWSGVSLTGLLEKSWGPLGISTDPEGTLTVLLQASAKIATDVYVVKLNADLTGATVLDGPANVPPDNDYDESPMYIDGSSPFVSPAGAAVSDLLGAGPQVVGLSAMAPGAHGSYAGVIFSTEPVDAQVSSTDSDGPEYWKSGEGIAEGFEANIGVRLLESVTGEEAISDPQGHTIVNTLGNGARGGSCNIGASEATLAAGTDGSLWILERGPKSDEPETSGQGREIIELAPSTGQLCPQPSGTFTMTAAGEASKTGEETLTVPAGTSVAFDASSINRRGGKPFAYEWDLDGSTTGGPAHDGFDKVYEMQPIHYYYPPASITYVYTRPGTYEVRFRMHTDYGVYTPPHPGTVIVTKAPAQPEPRFTATPSGQQVTFNAAASTPGVGTIVNYHWNWGDGSEEDESANTPVVTHTYARADSYQVTLTVTNSAYQSVTSAPQTVTVVAPPAPAAAASLSGPLYDIPLPFALYQIPPVPTKRTPTRLSPHTRFADGTLAVTLACPASRKLCAGAVSIETAAAIVAAKGGKGKRRARRLLLGHATFSIPGGHSRTVKVRLSARGTALLRSSKRLKVLVVVSAHDSFGDPGTTTLRLTLNAPVAHPRGSSVRATHSRH